MSNNAMSNETDLDWLARNVHVWAEDWTHVRKCPVHHEAKWMASLSPNAEYKDWRTKQQWLARRAELQNKPSWEDAPAWAELLAQDDSGKWYWYAAKPTHPGMKSWWPAPGSKNAQCGKGEVLGDWRDTLEKRPEEFKPSIEEANRLAQEFNPFISIEDNQEQEMKQDNRWFERGELPPVGVECEAKKYGKEEWYKVVICGAGKHLGLAVAFYEKQKGSGAFTCSSAEYFRPIRTEREMAIEHMQSDIAERWANCEELAKHLVDKGWIKGGK